jgi:predicted nucleic acid-binding protein
MTKYFLDTGIILGFIRGSDYAKFVEEQYRLFESQNEAYISIVTVGEILSLSIQFNWEEKKKNTLNKIIHEIPCIDIDSEDVLNRYAEIDAYCLGKNRNKPLPEGHSAKKIQKNDLWIAATASVLNSTLITIDHDFDFLNQKYLNVIYIDKSQKISR